MTLRPPVLNPDGEWSTRLLMTTLAQLCRQEALLANIPFPKRGRLQVLPSSSTSVQIRRQATLVRLTSIVEAYVSDQLVRRFEPHAPPPRGPILEDVYIRAEDNAIGSWPRMVDHYRRWFKVHLTQSKCPSWRRIEAMTNARNIVAHGLGELTRRMARKGTEQLKRDLATVDIGIAGNVLVLSEESLRSAAQAGREFIQWLDLELSTYDRVQPVRTP